MHLYLIVNVFTDHRPTAVCPSLLVMSSYMTSGLPRFSEAYSHAHVSADFLLRAVWRIKPPSPPRLRALHLSRHSAE